MNRRDWAAQLSVIIELISGPQRAIPGNPELSFIKYFIVSISSLLRYILSAAQNIIAGIVNQSVCPMWVVIHYFSRCKSNDDLMHRRIKDCRHEAPEYLTLRWRFISYESENDFRKVLQICTEERIETLVSRSGWLWQQPQPFNKNDKIWIKLSDWLATAVRSFNLLMHIYYAPISWSRPGHWGMIITKSHWLT